MENLFEKRKLIRREGREREKIFNLLYVEREGRGRRLFKKKKERKIKRKIKKRKRKAKEKELLVDFIRFFGFLNFIFFLDF